MTRISMNQIVHSRFIASISEFKKNPMGVVQSGEGEAVAILNRNKPAFYCVPAELYETLMDQIEDLEILEKVEQVKNEPTVKVAIENLKLKK